MRSVEIAAEALQLEQEAARPKRSFSRRLVLHVPLSAVRCNRYEGLAFLLVDGEVPPEFGRYPVCDVRASGIGERWQPLGGVLVGLTAVRARGHRDEGTLGVEVIRITGSNKSG